MLCDWSVFVCDAAKSDDEAKRRDVALVFVKCFEHFHGTLQRLPWYGTSF